MILIQAKHCQKTAVTSQPLYNILPVLMSLKKVFRSICLCETAPFDLFIDSPHLSGNHTSGGLPALLESIGPDLCQA